MNRRQFVKFATALPAGAALTPLAGFVRDAWAQQKAYSPRPGEWRTYEVTTQVEILKPAGPTRIWLPLPSVDSDYQKSLDNKWNAPGAKTRVVEDGK